MNNIPNIKLIVIFCFKNIYENIIVIIGNNDIINIIKLMLILDLMI